MNDRGLNARTVRVMKRTALAALAVLAATTVVAAPTTAAADTPAPVVLAHWACAQPVTVLVDPAGGPTDALAQAREFYATAALETGMTFTVAATDRRPGADGAGAQPGEILVGFGGPADYPALYAPEAGAPFGAYGNTYRELDTRGRLADAGVTIRSDAPGYVVRHELGHTLGLEHGPGLSPTGATQPAAEAAAHCR